MLKIKDNVDLKELEKFGFLEYKDCYSRSYNSSEITTDINKETGLKPILGVRGGESALRKSKYKSCFTKDFKFTPIHDLSDELLDKIYDKYNIEIPKVYNYICRTGCMGCPYGSYKHDTEKELTLINEAQRKFVFEYFKESYEVLGIKNNIQITMNELEGVDND